MKKFTLLVVTSFSIGISILLIVIFTRVNEEYTNTSDIGKKQYKEFKKIKNVVLIIACSLRADHLSCYGYERKTSPNIWLRRRDKQTFSQILTRKRMRSPRNMRHITGSGWRRSPSRASLFQLNLRCQDKRRYDEMKITPQEREREISSWDYPTWPH